MMKNSGKNRMIFLFRNQKERLRANAPSSPENKEKIKQNSEIIEEIASQYTIYQENEIYIKAVEKITEYYKK